MYPMYHFGFMLSFVNHFYIQIVIISITFLYNYFEKQLLQLFMYHFEDTRKVAHFGLIVPFFKPYIKSLHKFLFFLFYSLRYSRDFEKFYEFHRPIEIFPCFFSNPLFFFFTLQNSKNFSKSLHTLFSHI